MTAHQHELAQALARCTFTPGSTEKRFVRWAAKQPRERELSAKSIAFLERLAHSYQLGRCMAENCPTCAAALSGTKGAPVIALAQHSSSGSSACDAISKVAPRRR